MWLLLASCCAPSSSVFSYAPPSTNVPGGFPRVHAGVCQPIEHLNAPSACCEPSHEWDRSDKCPEVPRRAQSPEPFVCMQLVAQGWKAKQYVRMVPAFVFSGLEV